MRDDRAQIPTQCLSDVRLCVTGGSSVGKSAISVRFLTRRFIGEYQRDAEHTYRGLIDFGPDTIKYDLKDTSRLVEKSFFSTWPTCVAVVYSINDSGSFATASQLLDDIDTPVSAEVNSDIPSLALIGNKSDLEHLRNVRKVDGQRLADKHGATFWESSASEDYYSTFRPLTALIIKSFLKWKNNYGSHRSSGPEDVEIKSLLQRYSEPMNNTSQLISVLRLPSDCQRKDSNDNLTNNISATISTSIQNSMKCCEKLRELKSQTIISDSPSSSRSTTPTTPAELTSHTDSRFPLNNMNIERKDASNNSTLSKMSWHYQSQNQAKNNISPSTPFIPHKGKGSSKQQIAQNKTSSNSMEKFHSLTDLKTLQYLSMEDVSSGVSSATSDLALTSDESRIELSTLERSNSMNALLSRSQSMRYGSFNGRGNKSSIFKSLYRSRSFRYSASAGKINDKIHTSKEKLASTSTSSFTAIDDNQHNRNLLRRLQKDRHKLSILFNYEKTNDNMERNINRKADTFPHSKSYDISSSKSMRRKISSMFRPRSMNMSTD